MPLKALLTKEEYDTLTDEQKKLYAEQDGKFVYAGEIEDVAGLKNALTAEREEAKKAKKLLQETAEKYKDIDPEKARAAQQKLLALEDKKLLDEGKVDELLKERTERMRQDFDSQIKVFNKRIGDLETANAGYVGQLSELLIDNSIREVGLASGVRKAALPDVILRGKQVWRLKDKTPTAMRGDEVIYGKDPNKPLTMEEWVTGLQTDAPHLFESSSGGGAQNTPGASGRTIRLSREEAKNPQTYRTAKAQAEKLGIPMEIV